MKVNEFFHKYANLPLNDRFKILDMNNHGELTLSQINSRIKLLEDLKRPAEIEITQLLRIAEKFMKLTKI